MEHAVQLTQDGVVPEAQDAKAGLLQDFGSGGIICGLVGMLPAIQLHDQFGLEAGEVGEIAVDRDLSAELEAVELPVPQAEPKPSFGLGPVTP